MEKIQKHFAVYNISYREVLIPPSDYYARKGDSDTCDMQVLNFLYKFDTEKEALDYIENYLAHIEDEVQLTIIPVFTLNK